MGRWTEKEKACVQSLMSEKFRTNGGTPIYSGEYFNASVDDKVFINRVRRGIVGGSYVAVLYWLLG